MSGVKMGGVQMVQVDGQFHVWTKRVGSGPIQMLTLHGGPGCTHEYFECFEDFLSRQGIQFIYYDQLGSAYSDQPENSSLWTVERFREEWSRLGRHSAWINSTSTDIPGAVCWQSNTR